MALTPPPGYVARPPTLDDAEEILALTIACDIADIGEPNCDIDDVRGDLQDDAVDLEQDAALVFAESGALATYAVVNETIAFVYVHPDHVDRGLGSALVPFVEERTRAHGGDVVRQQVDGTNDRARALLSAHGYTAAQRFWQMRIALDVEPAAAVWPEEVTVRAFAVPADEREAYELVQLTFSEIPGYVPDRFERWRANSTARAQFAPDLSWVAEIEGRMIGLATCECWEDAGYLGFLSVAPDQRSRGLGHALLLTTFSAFRAAGMRSARLSVNAANRSGTRLYEAAGMHVAWMAERWEKPLSPASGG